MTVSVATALQKQLEALLADFTTRLTRLVREATLEDLVPRRVVTSAPAIAPRRPAPAPAPAPVRPRAAKRAPQRRSKAPARLVERTKPRVAKPSLPATERSLEETILGHLRSGVLLTVSELLAFGPTESEVRTAIDRLAARGVIGFSGQEPDPFVFAKSGNPEPVAMPAPAPAPAPVVVTVLKPATPKASRVKTSKPVASASPPEPAPPPPADGTHPFVVRRKKADAPS